MITRAEEKGAESQLWASLLTRQIQVRELAQAYGKQNHILRKGTGEILGLTYKSDKRRWNCDGVADTYSGRTEAEAAILMLRSEYPRMVMEVVYV